MDEWRNEPVLTVRSSYKERGTRWGRGGGRPSRARCMSKETVRLNRERERTCCPSRGRLRLRFRLPRARTNECTHARARTRDQRVRSYTRYNIVTVPRLSFTESHPRCRLPLMPDSYERQQSSMRSFQVKDLSLFISERERARLPPVSSRSDT